MIVDLLLDPEKALNAVNQAVSLIKKASKTAQNVESLGPLLGRYFDAKTNALACVQKSKATGSSMGKAIELEMALEAQRQFEEDLKNLFFSAGKMDVWQRIKARAALMEVEAAKAAGAEKRRLARKKEEDEEAVMVAIAIAIVMATLAAVIYFAWVFIESCSRTGCG